MSSTVPALVDVDWLRDHLDDDALVIVDSTTHLPVPTDGPYVPESGAESYRAEHIPGALFADLLTDFADADATQPWTAPGHDRFAAAAGALGIGEGATVVVYDQHDGFWATRLWWQLRLEGFDDVAVLDGGLRAWKAAGLEVTDAESTPVARTFTGEHRPGLIRSTAEIAAALDDPDTLLVNVLDEATYRGEVDTYARRGHIPGSINFPVFTLRDAETGALRAIDDLRAEFEKAGLLDTDRTVVTYCGGGIAATGVAHALALAGRDDVAVYDGSMTAWAGDPELPLVTGDSPR
ncbi:sulfurtransferase [Gordonia desulfuricans]|uniref:Sulfurtransferase n=1 Tax=Gordonia desulfuricans TaxID=89051 RepID=A0A7K3LMU2_9ACTN|nr:MULTISPECIES: rhodanese-like domain-containing protein [Gordonia]EMP10626.2 thiosulfate sulfurtransferase [Gordonia sp. NB41Y]NDK88847.1 sulfurtransferase [Gordonia desulfuricans]WLP92515.1 rhodanese-like domain-containing protein [Gordonia sp. NB41Y]